MENSIEENGNKIKSTGMEFTNGQMEANIKDIIRMDIEVEMV